MRKNLLYKLLLICIGICSLTDGQSQASFRYKTVLNNVASPGFYKISLPPAIVAKSMNELKDVRILDEKGSQVPYILRSEKASFKEKQFIEFPILEIKRESDKQTHLVVDNNTGMTANELFLVIKNTDAERMVTLSGSDDRKQWFVIKEQIWLSNAFNNEKDRFVQSLDFPNSSYKYFELTINGKDLLPVNIVKVGVYKGTSKNGDFIDVPGPDIIQTDSADNHSYIELRFKENYLINKLQLNVNGPKFFRRNMTIKSGQQYSTGNYILASDADPSYTVNVRSRKLLMVVDNEDSPPVKITSAKAYQLNKYLLCYLEPERKYELSFGDSTLKAPRYDLEFFKDSLNNNVREVGTGAISNIKETSNTIGVANKNTTLLWVIIISVLALLLVLTFRMTRDVARKGKAE